MIDIDTDAAAPLLLAELRRSGGPTENKLEGLDTYKPFYRILALMVAPQQFQRDVLGGECPTLEQAKEIASKAHPWLKERIGAESDIFDFQYNGFVDIWYGD